MRTRPYSNVPPAGAYKWTLPFEDVPNHMPAAHFRRVRMAPPFGSTDGSQMADMRYYTVADQNAVSFPLPTTRSVNYSRMYRDFDRFPLSTGYNGGPAISWVDGKMTSMY